MILFAFLLLGGGVWYWRSTGGTWPPQWPGRLAVSTDSTAGQVLGDIDSALAETIRQVASGSVHLPSLPLSNWTERLSTATMSATVSTTPAELWQTLRAEGAAAVAQDLAQNAQVQVGNVSLDVVSEARYQYCVGVVDEYEKRR